MPITVPGVRRGVQLLQTRGGRGMRCFVGSASEQVEQRPRQAAESSNNQNKVLRRVEKEGAVVRWTPSSSATATPHERVSPAASRHCENFDGARQRRRDATGGTGSVADVHVACWAAGGKER